MKRSDIAIGIAAACWFALFALTTSSAEPGKLPSGVLDWLLMALLHMPFITILCFLAIGFFERFDYFRVIRQPHQPGVLPHAPPLVCIQLPMFNEDAVAERIISAAVAMEWPVEALEVQVLDDSTDPATKERVRAFCQEIAQRTGVDCRWIHRVDRKGYKAGALEEGRKGSKAEYFAIFDADFLPPADFLARAIPHFYDDAGQSIDDLAVVQAQWGHLNDDESFLTKAQAMWVDDHHTIQKTWRSTMIGFVNFTGTAGVWRAQAIEDAGGWRAASLVEDCELSIRALLAGYRTRFVGSIIAPAELPQTIAAYRSQQKRWTQGWAQLQRMHFPTLMRGYRTGLLRRIYLLYFAGIAVQWALWTVWILVMPFLIASGLWLGAFGTSYAMVAYVSPPLFFAVFAALIAANEAKPTYAAQTHCTPAPRLARFGRLLPYMIVNTGMMPHHFCAYLEGMFGPLHAEFVRTPKTASTGGMASQGAVNAVQPLAPARKKLASNRPYLRFELFFCATLVVWAGWFLNLGLISAAIWAAWILVCIVGLRIAPHLNAFLRKGISNAG